MAPLREAGQPVHDGDGLVPNFTFGKACRPADDSGYAHAAFEKGALGSEPFAGVAATAVRAVVVPFGQAAVVVIHGEAGFVFNGMTIVALKDDDGVFGQAEVVELFHDEAHVVVRRRDDGGVGTAGHGQILIELGVFLECLLRVVRDVVTDVEQERILLVPIDEFEGAFGDQFREIFAILENFGGAFEEVVKPLLVQEVVVVVIDEAIADPEEFIEALLHRAEVAMGTDVPFAEETGAVAGVLQHFGEGHFLQGHVDPIGAVDVVLGPGIDSGALRVPSGQKRGARRAANGMGIGLGEADAVSCETVDRGGVEIVGSVTARIERALVVGVENDDVGF